jgi:hypothetical protein
METEVKTRADGAAGARRCAAMLGIALCAETVSASLQEEAMKVDMKVSFRDPLTKVSRNVNCQVKSGNSYRADSSNSDRIKLKNILPDTLAVFQSDLGIIAWVPPKPSSAVYWFICRRNTQQKQIVILRDTQKISPALRFILSREFVQRENLPSVSQQTVSPTGPPKVVLTSSRMVYRQIGKVDNPLFGEVSLSRAAWRHITRASKPKDLRLRSLRVVPHLKTILAVRPDSHSVKEANLRTEGSRSIESRKIVCWYSNALLIDGQRRTLMLRIHEEISYPSKWYKYPLIESDIVQKATLLSWWVKEKSIRLTAQN